LLLQPNSDAHIGQYTFQVKSSANYAQTQPTVQPCTMDVIIKGCNPADISFTITIGESSSINLSDEI